MGFLRYEKKELGEEHPFFDISSRQNMAHIASQHDEVHKYLTSLYRSPY